MPDRHKSHPKTVRMPGGLLPWYEEHAKSSGRPVNAILVAALEEYRERHGSGSTTAPSTPEAVAPPKRSSITVPVTPERLQELRDKALAADIEPVSDPAELARLGIEAHCAEIAAQSRPPKNCKHPKVRGKGVCPDCHTWVPSK